MTLEEFILRLLVQAARKAAANCWQVHDEAPLAVELTDAAMAIETTIEVWAAMEAGHYRDLFDLSVRPWAIPTWKDAK